MTAQHGVHLVSVSCSRATRAFLAAVLLYTGALSYAARTLKEEELIGWLGETYEGGSNGTQQPQQHRALGMRVLSWDPRIMHYRRFLTEDECDQVISAARPRLERSGVSNAETGEGEESDIRTSSGMFFNRNQTQLIGRIEQRVAAWTQLPPGHSEGMQVLHYEPTQKYDPHHDYFSFKGRDDNGGNRLATVLMYLTDVEEGGETVFPKVPAPPTQTKEQGWSECALQGLAVKPRKGDAVLFWSIRPDGTFDYKSLHGSCPVVRGEKWSATKWIHVGHYADGGEPEQKVVRVVFVPPKPPSPAWCKDTNSMCDTWAESGECEANPGFMVGATGQVGACLRACDRCDLIPAEERAV